MKYYISLNWDNRLIKTYVGLNEHNIGHYKRVYKDSIKQIFTLKEARILSYRIIPKYKTLGSFRAMSIEPFKNTV